MTSSTPLYFKRYSEAVVEKAHALEIITTEQYACILKFYDENTFIIEGQAGVDSLKSFIPQVEQVDYIADKDLYCLQVKEWPHLKVMCLKCAPSNPCIWKYFDEEDNELFEYRIDTYSILCPSTPLSINGANTSNHGLD